jgi:hypothetical protein
VEVFASTVPGTVKPDAAWAKECPEGAGRSIGSHRVDHASLDQSAWIWFEVGASWSRMEIDQGRIYPLCAPEIDLGELPEPLSRLQALSLAKDTTQRLDQIEGAGHQG